MFRVYLKEKGFAEAQAVEFKLGKEKNEKEFVLRVKQFEHLLIFDNLKLRACYDCLTHYGGIIDDNLTVIFLDEGEYLKCIRSLWPDNNQITKNFKEHFENMWNKSISCPVFMTLF